MTFNQIGLTETVLFAALGLLLLISIIISIVSLRRAGRLAHQYRKMMTGKGGKDIEDLLMEALEKVRASVYQVEDLQQAYRKLAQQADGALQKVGVVRFNPFNDTGSDLSFAVALLDVGGNGVVITSLFGRDESRTYAKPVTNGNSPYQLSREEEEAIKRALQ